MDPQRRDALLPFFNVECAVAVYSRPTLGARHSAMSHYEALSLAQRPLYAVGVAKLALAALPRAKVLSMASEAVTRAAAWCTGEPVDAAELADLIHGDQDRGLDLCAQQAHSEKWPSAPALDAIIYSIAYVGWRINLLSPPVLQLFDNASEEMLGEMEAYVLACGVHSEQLQRIAHGLPRA